MRSSALAALTGVLLALASPAHANDRLPRRLRPGYRIAQVEVQKYMAFILERVFLGSIRKLAYGDDGWVQRRGKADDLVDEVVNLLLPQAKRIMSDAVFGTGETYLRIARPRLREEARKAALEGLKISRSGALRGMLPIQGAGERALNDRLERALLEDMGDYAAQWVEGAVGLPLRGRGRNWVRPLPSKWEKRYRAATREAVHRYVYWWLRKKERLSLTQLALTRTREQLDRDRHRGPIWGVASGASQEAWAQNRLRIGFRWGFLDWQIDRRRIRRRMDQDLAQGTWALARMVKELMAPETMRQALEKLDRLAEKALERPELKEDLERYPESLPRLRRKLQHLKRKLDPIFNRAMARVKLPADMPPRLQDLTREHGRRFMREELEPNLVLAIGREAGALTAKRQLKRSLPDLAADALARFDRANLTREAQGQARAFVRKQVLPKAREELAEALRAAGQDEFSMGHERFDERVKRLMRRFDVGRLIEREAERQLSKGNR